MATSSGELIAGERGQRRRDFWCILIGLLIGFWNVHRPIGTAAERVSEQQTAKKEQKRWQMLNFPKRAPNYLPSNISDAHLHTHTYTGGLVYIAAMCIWYSDLDGTHTHTHTHQIHVVIHIKKKCRSILFCVSSLLLLNWNRKFEFSFSFCLLPLLKRIGMCSKTYTPVNRREKY